LVEIPPKYNAGKKLKHPVDPTKKVDARVALVALAAQLLVNRIPPLVFAVCTKFKLEEEEEIRLWRVMLNELSIMTEMAASGDKVPPNWSTDCLNRILGEQE
jgi:hypothetical protein